MSGSTKTVSDNKSTQTNTTDPAQMGMLTNNYTGAQSALSGPTTYQGDTTAPFNATQIQAQGVLSGVATDPSYAANNNAAIGAVQGVLNNPAATSYNAAQLSNTDLSPYLNPYTQNVINTTNHAIGLQRQTAQTQDSQQATAANAFGGSRSGVMGALTNQLYDQDTAQTDAGLNQANFSQAQNAALSDIGARNNASQFNINSGLTGQSQRVSAAGVLAGLNQQGLSLASQQGGILSAVGDAQQQQQQAALTSAYQNWAAGKQLSIQEQQLLNQTIGLFPNQQTVSSTGSGTSDTTKTPGLTDIIGALGSAAGGAGAMGLKLSDGRAKSDVCTIRHDARGRRWVSFRYNWEPEGTRHEGVIAQEILKSDPHAVHMGADGFYRVNYDALTEAA